MIIKYLLPDCSSLITKFDSVFWYIYIICDIYCYIFAEYRIVLTSRTAYVQYLGIFIDEARQGHFH